MGQNSTSRLRQIMRDAPKTDTARCELCAAEIPSVRHRHLLEINVRQVRCVCDPCALRFHDVVGGNFKLIPRDVKPLPDFRITDGQWEDLAIPINLAFFFHSSLEDKLIAMYPSPAGATESLLSLGAWQGLVAENPVLAELESDVEALLVKRVGKEWGSYRAPIDTCYKLVGLIRVHWRGLSGGKQVWQEIEQFFDQFNEKDKNHV